jgi:PAS domain S-box-containing protein
MEAGDRPDTYPMKRFIWAIYLLVGALGGLAYYFLPPIAKSGLFFNVLGISSVVAILVGTRMHRPQVRLPWNLFALGQALFIGGDVITYNYPQLFHTEIPFPSVGDVLYLAVYPVLIGGLLMLIRRRNPGGDRDGLIDSLIITIGVGLVSWTFLMAPYAHDHSLSLVVKIVSIAYPLMDVLLLAVTIRLAVGAGKRDRAFYLLAAGVMALLATDAVYGLSQLSGVIYQNGGPLEAGWLSFYLLWGAAALHPSMASVAEPSRTRGLVPARRRLALLAGVAVLGPTVNMIQGIRGESVDPGIVSAGSATMFLLVLARVRGLMVDINEHRRTERQLREAENKYRSLVERLPAIVYVAEFGKDGRWIYVSPRIEEILGFTQEDWMRRPELWHERLHPDDRDRAFGDELKVLETGERLRTEYRIRAADDRLVWIREEADILRDDSGRPQFLQGVMFDISDQKLAEETLKGGLETERMASQHLRDLQDMQNSFLEAVSHDLRTPLTSIMGAALTLEREDITLSAGDTEDFVHSIAANARKLNRLLGDLLDLDRLARGILEPRRKMVDLRRLVLAVVDECNLEGHTLTVDEAAPIANVDRAQVERIVENLITNAVRYTPAGTQIWVRLESSDGGAVITVEDDGPGVSPEIRKAIFEPFRQGHEVIQHSPGVGIGLSLVVRFAQLHGGRAWVEERQGGGASFKVFLPDESPTRPAEDAEDDGAEPEPLLATVAPAAPRFE